MKKSTFTALAALLPALAFATDGWHNISANRPVPPAGTVYWQEDFETTPIENFKIEFRNGAKGEVKIVDSRHRNGKKSLLIKKSNHDGYIVITPAKPCAMPVNTELQCSIYASCSDANPMYTPAFIRMYGKVPSLEYYGKLDGRGPGGPRMSKMLNSAPNVWERKLCHRKSDADTGNMITPAIVVAGPPSTSYWDDWKIENFFQAKEAWYRYLKSHVTPDDTASKMPDAEFDKFIAADTDHTAKIVVRDGYSRLVIDGQERLPVLYKDPAWVYRYTSASKKLHDSGAALQSIFLRMGNTLSGPWKDSPWTKDGFDVKKAVHAIREKMRYCPEAVFSLSINCDPYPEFGTRYPDEVWTIHNGQKGWGHHVHMQYFIETKKMDPKTTWLWASMFSKVWRQQAKENISALIAELKRTGLSKRIVGIHISGFHDGQYGLRRMDYSKPAEEAFREYLKEKYGTIENLRKAWKRKNLKSFDRIYPPTYPARECFVPGRHQDLIDFYVFQKVTPFKIMEELAAHAKAEFGKDIIAIRYCIEAFGGTLGSTLDITPFTRSKVYDALCGQTPYEERTPGMSCQTILPTKSFHLNGKILLEECDLRTYGVGGVESELRVLGLSRANDFAEWQSIHHKVAGRLIARDQGYWYYDQAGGWFNPPEILADIQSVLAFWKELSAKPKNPWHPDAAIVIDEAGQLLRNYPYYHYNRDVVFNVTTMLSSVTASGAPFDLLLMDDLLRNPALAKQYKVVIFTGMNHVDSARRNLIDSLKNSDRTLVFMPGTGRVGGADVTGFKIKELGTGVQHNVVPAEGVNINMLSTLYADQLTRMLGRNFSDAYQCPTRFTAAEEEGVKVFARFKADNAPAMAAKQFPGYRSVMVGAAGGLSPEFLNYLMHEAKAYTVSDAGLQVDMNGNFISIHAIMPGKFTIELPFECKVRNVKSGKFEQVSGKKFTLDAIAGSTYWFELIK
ncbi:MAG: hypothetical protein E7041_05390 [Lentisphaerae bacterium]|nr:hypothetical protein [Lentisphaerota bacterium]